MRRICPYEIYATIIVVAVLAFLLLPSIHPGGCGGGGCGHQASCASNMRQLYTLGTVYAANHKGQWPDVQEGNYWMVLTKTTPPLIAAEHREILNCPVREESDRDCDYRGPKVPWSSLRTDDPIAVCRRGNHGEREPLNVLFKDGSVMEVDLDDPRWKRWNELLGP